MHLGEGVGFEEVVDGGGGAARAFVAGVGELRGGDEVGGLVGADEPAAFAWVGLEIEDALYFGCGHAPIVNSGSTLFLLESSLCLTCIHRNTRRTRGGIF